MSDQDATPTVRYADDSTLLARLRIEYARRKPRGQQEEALTAGWLQIVVAAVVDLILSVLWATVWFKAVVWLISTYWWTRLPGIGWLPAMGLMLALKLLLLRPMAKATEPFVLPARSPSARGE